MVIKYPCFSTVILRGKRSGGFIWLVRNCGASLLPANLKHKALATSALCCAKITDVLGQTAAREQSLHLVPSAGPQARNQNFMSVHRHIWLIFFSIHPPLLIQNPPQIILFAISFPLQELLNHLLWLVMALSILQLWFGGNSTIITLGFVLSKSWILPYFLIITDLQPR